MWVGTDVAQCLGVVMIEAPLRVSFYSERGTMFHSPFADVSKGEQSQPTQGGLRNDEVV